MHARMRSAHPQECHADGCAATLRGEPRSRRTWPFPAITKPPSLSIASRCGTVRQGPLPGCSAPATKAAAAPAGCWEPAGRRPGVVGYRRSLTSATKEGSREGTRAKTCHNATACYSRLPARGTQQQCTGAQSSILYCCTHQYRTTAMAVVKLIMEQDNAQGGKMQPFSRGRIIATHAARSTHHSTAPFKQKADGMERRAT